MRALFVSVLCVALSACASGFNSQSTEPTAYVVFFDLQSTALTQNAKAVIVDVARRARENPDATVEITGPGTKIAPGYDPRMAEPRIEAVIAELVADGVSPDKIVQTSVTTDNIKVDASGARRVEIRIVAGRAT